MDKKMKIFTVIFIIGALALGITIYSDVAPKKSSSYDRYNSAEDCKESISPEVCYRIVAEKTGDLSLCERIREYQYTDDDDISLCYGQAGKANNNVEGCSKATIILHKENCYIGIARSTNNPSLCDNIREGNFKDTCILQSS
ncbi:MAG: hypothetical protein ABIH34_04125 [Nanoarchaeota archaeon]